MTRTRAATSVSLTIGAAVATLLVAGGILVGPTILDCSRDGGSMGACLRDRLDHGGFLTTRPPDAPPASPSEVPVHGQGWIEANATEYEPPPPGVAELHGPPGALGVTGSVVRAPSAVGGVAMAPNPQQIGGGGAAAGGSTATIDIALAEAPGRLAAGGSIPAATPATDMATLTAPGGSLAVGGAGGASVTAGAPADASSVPLPDVGGQVGAHPISGGVTLEALVQPEPSTPELVAVEPPIPLTTPPPSTADIAPEAPVAAPDPPRKVPKFNPRYPNVLVAPPPAKGANSSIVTLQLR